MARSLKASCGRCRTCRAGRLSFRGRAPLAGVACLVGTFSMTPVRSQGLQDEDRVFAEALIQELRYFDTARRWLNQLRSSRGVKPPMKAEIDSRLIDILQAEGKTADALAALDEFKKNYPTHPRAALGSLEQLGAVIGDVLSRLENAELQKTDSKKAATMLAGAKSDFAEKIEKPLEALVKDLFRQAAESKDDKGNEDSQKKRLAYQAELVQVNIYLVYARALPADDKDREQALEKGLEFATRFVENRFEFYIMQYKAQIQKGLYLLELGRHAAAAEELSLLYDIEPPYSGEYPPALVKAFHEIRLQALLFGARALNVGSRHTEAADQLRRLMKAKLDPTDRLLPVIGHVEKDPFLEKFAVQARLEFGVAVAAAGDISAGMASIHKVIAKYEKLYSETEDPKYNAYVIDARKALGQVSSGGKANLSGRDYYQAGIGLKSQLKLEEALLSFQRGLAALSATERDQYAPLCLNEIGEICYIMERYDESALAFSEIAYFYSGSDIFLQKAARSFVGAVNKAKGELGVAGVDHAGFLVLEKKAAEKGDPDVEHQANLANAQRLEQQAQYSRARTTYLKIPIDNPTYGLRAHSSAWATYMREYETASAGSDKAVEARIVAAFPEGIDALKDILARALEKEDARAAAVSALALGQMQFQSGAYADAVSTLKLFAGKLGDDRVYRCAGLGYLVLSAVRDGKGKTSSSFYALLNRSCKAEAATAAAAYALSDDATARGELKAAGIYMLHYAQHPSTGSDLQDKAALPLLIKIVQVLSDGGLISDARKYVEMAKAVGGDGGDLLRVLLWMEAKIAKSAQDWSKVIALLNRYVKEYGVKGDNYEDPFVCQELGWATIKLARLKTRKGTLPLAACFEANKFYGHALYLLDSFIRRSRERGQGVSSVVSRDYWNVALRLMQINSHIGRNGDKDGYNDIHKFVNENKERLTGQPRLRSRFEKLWREALEGLNRAPSDYGLDAN